MSSDGKQAITEVVTNLPQQYRARAEEARRKAEMAHHEDKRKKYLQIAETWERMAQHEELAKRRVIILDFLNKD
jgi:hypothetical protein